MALPNIRRAAQSFENCVLFRMTVEKFGNTRNVRSALIETPADASMMRHTKKLVDSEKLERIGKFDNDTRLYVSQTFCLPFEGGLYIVPVPRVEALNTYLVEREIERNLLIDEFCGEWEQLVSAAYEKLKELFSDTDYPEAEEVRRRFSVSWSFISLQVPEELPQEILEAERAKAAERIQNVAEQTVVTLRETAYSLVQHLWEQMQPSEELGADGKPKTKKLFDSSVTKLIDFAEQFNNKNLAGDDDLEQLVSMTRDLASSLSGDMKKLKKDGDFRTEVTEVLGAIKDGMGELVKETAVLGISRRKLIES